MDLIGLFIRPEQNFLKVFKYVFMFRQINI